MREESAYNIWRGGSKCDAIYVKMLYMYIEEEKTDKNECRCPMRYERFIVTHVCHSLSTFMAALHIQLYISHHHIQFQKRVSNIHINSQLKHTHSTKTILSPMKVYSFIGGADQCFYSPSISTWKHIQT